MFAFTLAHHICHIDLSPWESMWRSFMNLIGMLRTFLPDLCMTLTFDLNIIICIFDFLSLARLSLLFDIGIPRSGIGVYYHETKCCVHSWPLFDLDIWPICGWRGYLKWVLLTIFILLWIVFSFNLFSTLLIFVLWGSNIYFHP